jgi:HlyD family secretion protein
MIRKFLLPILAVCGIALAIYTVKASQKDLPPAPPVAPPPTSAFGAQIAGAGLVEAESENIAIGTDVPGTVVNIAVNIGDKVAKGQKLFDIDTRDLDAQMVSKKAAVEAAKARLEKLKLSPRPEEVPPAEAKVIESEANLADRKAQLKRLDDVLQKNTGAISQDEYSRAKYAVDVAQAELTGAQANLQLVKSGTWTPDLKIAEADLASAEAEVKGLQIELSRRSILSPIDGTVLQVKTHLGEYATAGQLATPLLMLGATQHLNVRVDIDENDAWRLRPGAKAVASLRGNSGLKCDLTFVRVEPYVVPKRSLTGDSTERVDTRVLQVIYRIDKAAFPLYAGQQMDVFIDAENAATTQP